jgi:hypothetical protein
MSRIHRQMIFNKIAYTTQWGKKTLSDFGDSRYPTVKNKVLCVFHMQKYN